MLSTTPDTPLSEEAKRIKLVLALAIMVLDKNIRKFLEENDPKALAQAIDALDSSGFYTTPDKCEHHNLLDDGNFRVPSK